MIRKLYEIMRNFTKQVSQDNVSAHAASTAFFLFLSLIPLLMLVCAILPYTPVTEAVLMKFLVELTPDSANALVLYLVGEVYDQSAGVLSAAAIVTVWIAAKGMMALIRGLNAVNGIREQRNYFVLRIEACLYTVLMLAAMIVALVLLVFGNTLSTVLFRKMPALGAFIRFFLQIRFLSVWLILTLVFAIIYTYVPKIKTRFRF
jgi:membrane protein